MWQNPQKTPFLITFTEEILTEKLHFLCSATQYITEEAWQFRNNVDEIISAEMKTA